MFAAASAALSLSLGGDVYGDSERGVRRVWSSSRKFSSMKAYAARFLAIRGDRFGSTGVDGIDGAEGGSAGGDCGDGGDGAKWRERTLEVGEDMRGSKLEFVGGSRK